MGPRNTNMDGAVVTNPTAKIPVLLLEDSEPIAGLLAAAVDDHWPGIRLDRTGRLDVGLQMLLSARDVNRPYHGVIVDPGLEDCVDGAVTIRCVWNAIAETDTALCVISGTPLDRLGFNLRDIVSETVPFYVKRSGVFNVDHVIGSLHLNTEPTSRSNRGYASPRFRLFEAQPKLLPPPKLHVRILHIEDDEAFARLIREWIRDSMDLNVELIHKTTLEDALKYLVEPCPDAVLLDLGLPGVGGMQALLAVLEACPRACVVVVTGNVASRDKCFEMGASAFIAKDDATPETIIDTIRDTVSERLQNIAADGIERESDKVQGALDRIRTHLQDLQRKNN